MSALTLSDIVTAIRNPQNCIRHPLIREGSVITYQNRPICFSGNYGAVFKYQTSNGIKALRVWTKDLDFFPDITQLTKLISKQISLYRLDCFVHFEYVENGLLSKGELHPILIMDWCDGTNLKEFIKNNLGNTKCLLSFRNRFLKLIKDLHTHGISHGDLQHGNIIVDGNGEIKLIDYDSMYFDVLEFKNKTEVIKGLPDYQHPSRILNKYITPKADYFSELVIFISICALIDNPDLWNKYNVESRDYSLLFDAKEFPNFKQSKLYDDLINCSQEVQDLLSVFISYLSENDINNLSPFYHYLPQYQDKAIFCINCGKEFLSTEDLFCTKCGSKRL